MSDDIWEALEGWDFEPGVITVRTVPGDDGEPKVQMRLELGLIQMEMSGRPDGARPHGCESYLHYYRNRLKDHIRQYGSDAGFELDDDACELVRTEALHYYYRYLGLFHLEQYEQVAADTVRNLQASRFLLDYSTEDEDRYSIEQYRAYILMMNAQARARIARHEGELYEALGIVRSAVRKIEAFLDENSGNFGNSDESHELRLLEELEVEIIEALPEDFAEKLRIELKEAVDNELFEKAAILRDQIKIAESEGR